MKYYEIEKILELLYLFNLEHLDIRTSTLGINLKDCVGRTIEETAEKVYNKITAVASNYAEIVDEISHEYKIPIANKRISVTPIANIIGDCKVGSALPIGKALDRAGKEVGIDFLGGFSALVQKGISCGEEILINSIAETLSQTDIVCSSVNVATTRDGINIDAINRMAQVIKDTAERTKAKDGFGAAKLVVFSNAPEDNPFMAGAFHGLSQPDLVINVGISGPGVVRKVIEENPNDDFGEIYNKIKKSAYYITRLGELIGREVAEKMKIEMGIVDLSLAPTPAEGDSIAKILVALGLEDAGAPGSVLAVAMLNDAVKKGGMFATKFAGGLSGAFIPVLEDAGLTDAVKKGHLSYEKLESMTSVCSVGIDMVAIPGDTPVETIAATIADEIAIGVINNKTTGVRIIPVSGKKAGDEVYFGGLFGSGPIMKVSNLNSMKFMKRGGRIPAPIHSFKN